MTNSVDPDQTAPIGAVCYGTMLFASILNSSVMLGNYLLRTTSADNIFRRIFFLRALRVNKIMQKRLFLWEQSDHCLHCLAKRLLEHNKQVLTNEN